MTTPPNDATEPGLWRHADFLRLWAAQAISAFGSRITRTALPIIAVATLDQPDAVIGLLAAMQLAPGVVLAMLAGGFVDRSRKRRILIAADLIRGALVVSLTLAWALGALSMIHVVVVGAGVGAASALFQITDVAYLPSLIGRRRLVEGNAKLETTEAVAEITGPASAGVLIAALGAPLAVAIDAASYFWSAFMLGRIRARDEDVAAASRAPVDPEEAQSAAQSVRTGEDFRIGLRTVFGHPLVRPIVLTLMVWSIAGGFFMALYTPYCLRELGLSKATFGLIIAMGGVGSLGGAIVSRSLARVLGVGRTMLVTAFLSLLCTLLIPIAGSGTSPAVTIGLLATHQLFGDGFSVAFIILAVTLRQTVLPKTVLGRANAAVHVCTSGVLPITAILAGTLATLVGIRTAVWIGLLIGLTAPIFLWRLRHLQTMPTGEVAASDAAKLNARPT
ncbi:MAG TPA: MFS transporter [Kofleriaceae bacterium]|nr:MFS transporter [Kofleriaceae bacterium]